MSAHSNLWLPFACAKLRRMPPIFISKCIFFQTVRASTPKHCPRNIFVEFLVAEKWAVNRDIAVAPKQWKLSSCNVAVETSGIQNVLEYEIVYGALNTAQRTLCFVTAICTTITLTIPCVTFWFQRNFRLEVRQTHWISSHLESTVLNSPSCRTLSQLPQSDWACGQRPQIFWNPASLFLNIL